MLRTRSAFQRRCLLSAAILPALLVLAGCWWGGTKRFHEHGTLQAPPMRLKEANGRHVVLFRAPTPGWTIEYDRTVRTDTDVRVLVTIRRPDPTVLMPQVIVPKNLATPVRADQAIEVYGRVLDFDSKGSETPYRRVELDVGGG